MFKLTIISGPLRGNVYELQTGECILGRSSDVQIVINSQKVSKKHCCFSVLGSEVTVDDLGSSNGTFVNGAQVKSKKLSPGDRVTIGDNILELSAVTVKKVKPPRSHNVIPMPGVLLPSEPFSPAPFIPAAAAASPKKEAEKAPKDYVEKVAYYFNKHVVNFLYDLNEKHEWNVIIKGLLAILIIFTAAAAVIPVTSKTQDILLIEARNRAHVVARLMVERNTQAMLEKNEGKMDVSFVDKDDAVVGAFIVDMDLRIMAPGKYLNMNLSEYKSEGKYARFGANAKKHFNKKERYFSMPYWNEDGSVNGSYPILEGGVMGVTEPFKILDPQSGKNVVVAMAIVFLDVNDILMDSTNVMLLFLSTLVFGALMGLAVYTSIIKLTLRPLEHINTEMDKALRGEATLLQLSMKMQELKPLVEVINTSMQRITPSMGMSMDMGSSPEEIISPFRFLAQKNDEPMMVLDAERKVLVINSKMEEITGIRSDNAEGHELSSVARDEAFSQMIIDILGRAPVGQADAAVDSMEFSGKNYQIEAIGLGSIGGNAKGFVISLKEAA